MALGPAAPGTPPGGPRLTADPGCGARGGHGGGLGVGATRGGEVMGGGAPVSEVARAVTRSAWDGPQVRSRVQDTCSLGRRFCPRLILPPLVR